MNGELKEALRRVLDYAQPDEERDWDERAEDARGQHIVVDLRALRGWLDADEITPIDS